MILRPYKKIRELERKHAQLLASVRLACRKDDVTYLRGW